MLKISVCLHPCYSHHDTISICMFPMFLVTSLLSILVFPLVTSSPALVLPAVMREQTRPGKPTVVEPLDFQIVGEEERGKSGPASTRPGETPRTGSVAKIPLSASGIASNFPGSLAADTTGGQISNYAGSNKLCVASGDCCLLRQNPRGRNVCPPSC